MKRKKKENNSESNRSAKRLKANPPPMREPLEAIHLVQDFSTLKILTKNEITEARNSYTVKSTPNLQNKRKRGKSSNYDDVPFAESPLLNIPVPISVVGQEDEEKFGMRKKIEELQDELLQKNELLELLMERVRILETQNGEYVAVAGDEVFTSMQVHPNDTELPYLMTETSNFDLPPLEDYDRKGVIVSDFPNKVESVQDEVLNSGNEFDHFLNSDYQLFNFEGSNY